MSNLKFSLGKIPVVIYNPVASTARVELIKVGDEEGLIGKHIVYADIKNSDYYIENYPKWYLKLKKRIMSRAGILI
jgi:hypothetical protein